MAENIFISYYTELHEIRQYLVRFGKKRVTSDAAKSKLESARRIYINFEVALKLNEQVQLSDNTLKLAEKIKIKYSEIEKLMTETTMLAEFELKTAVALLPVMDGSETVTKQLIDAIELYSTMITEESKSNLIQFVLKTRLSQVAKLRLDGTYSCVTNMVADMKKHLLTTKSDVALQKKMQTCYQGNWTIEKFGSELEQMFVNLTISQAGGKDDAYKVLKPLNEKQAINKFAEGLKNEKLKTIIAARNYKTLKDAIQGAKDEEVNIGSSSSGQVFWARGRPFKRGFHSFATRGRQNYQGNSNNQNRSLQAKYTNFRTNYARASSRGNFIRSRGRSSGPNRSYHHKNYQNNTRRHYVNMTDELHDQEEKGKEELLIPETFFRD